ncbi:MAG: hypothetical protein JNL02_05950, partial [Saprospiraceae bacterium]|nr:hypothetical protein [Saprospiraceae bacterium]
MTIDNNLCDQLPAHPFKNAPGVSQRHRTLPALAPASVQIDGATLADRLLFIAEFARQINFFHLDEARDVVEIGNWQRFFSDSPPFVLARLITTDTEALEQQLEALSRSADQIPDPENVRMLRDFVHSDLFGALYDAFVLLESQTNALTLMLDGAIRTQLAEPLQLFLLENKKFSKASGIRLPDFQQFTQQEAWGLDIRDLYQSLPPTLDTTPGESLYRGIVASFHEQGQAALNVLRLVASEAPAFLPESLAPLDEANQQMQPPHLGLLFAFLQLFELFRDDLNGLSRQHLEYFFETVLHLSPRKARPDAAHLVLEVQKHLDRYLVGKGTAVKDGKDPLGAEVDFTLEEDIVVDKAQVDQVLTLYRNTQISQQTAIAGSTQAVRLTEGLYIAPKANSADGQGEAFAEGQSANWPTLGSKASKFVPKNKTSAKNHPPARLGFVLASPVLFLQEGKREVTFNLECRVLPKFTSANQIPNLAALELVFDEIRNKINQIFYVINEEALKKAIQDGLSPASAQQVEAWLERRNPYTTWSDMEPCPGEINECEEKGGQKNTTVCEENGETNVWKTAESLIGELPLADQVILQKHTRRTMFRLLFSGEKEWVPVLMEPSVNLQMSIAGNDLNAPFTLTAVATLTPDQPGVTFFNPENLKEQLGTDLPVAKFELDPDIKVWVVNSPGDSTCCLEKGAEGPGVYASLWHLFGNIQIESAQISVKVCGVRNLVVQNDENLQDVNSPIYPFGTRPEVPGFSVVEKNLTADPNQTGPNFFIGSREVFLKKWETVYINLEWKDLPTSFEEHYYAYSNNPLIHKEGFKIKTSILEEGNWIKETFDAADPTNPIPYPRELFRDDNHQLELCDPKGPTIQSLFVDAAKFLPAVPQYFHPEIKNPLGPLTTTSRNGFLGIQLYGQDFLHRDYPFVLARQMLAFGKYPDKIKEVPGAVLKFDPDDPPPALEDLLQVMVNDLLNNLAGTTQGSLTVSPVYPTTPSASSTTTSLEPSLISGSFHSVTRFNDGIMDVINQIINQVDDLKNVAIDLTNTDIPPIITGLLTLRDTIQGFIDLPSDIPVAGLVPLRNAIIDAIDGLSGQVPPIFPPPFAPFDQVSPDSEGTPRYNNGVEDKVDYIADGLSTILPNPVVPNVPDLNSIHDRLNSIIAYLHDKKQDANAAQNGGVPIPFEPYTPVLKYISLDYTATATPTDVSFIHLHPYPDTYKTGFFANTPTLIAAPPAPAPTLDEAMQQPAEGTLYLGLKNLTPGSNLNLLFQLAEATADTEAEKARVAWQYLSNNEWRDLREGFEVLDDATHGLTASGIVKIAVPPDITNGPENTVLPRGLHWLKVAVPQNSRAVCETLGIHTQAVLARFAPIPANDPARSGNPLPAGSLAKLRAADANVKQVQQPYDSFGGRAAEDAGGDKNAFYRRAAERLRHKGRAIAPFDYERLVLEAFPEIYKVKCISHAMALGAAKYQSDLEWAAG